MQIIILKCDLCEDTQPWDAPGSAPWIRIEPKPTKTRVVQNFKDLCPICSEMIFKEVKARRKNSFLYEDEEERERKAREQVGRETGYPGPPGIADQINKITKGAST